MKTYLVTGGAGFIGSNYIHYMFKKYEILRLTKSDFTALDGNLVRNMLGSGLSMGFMSSLVNIGSLTLRRQLTSLDRI